MSAYSTLETIPSSPTRLFLNIENIDKLVPYLSMNDFAVFHGSKAIKSLVNLLCVRAQLPFQLGGLETNVLYIDGGNSFRLYDVSSVAQNFELDPTSVLKRIFISRAFTAYQMTDLVMEQLETAVEKYDTKLVILANLAQLFLDKDIQKHESHEIFLQLTKYISDFAKKNRVITVATQKPYTFFKNGAFFKEVLCARADIVASIMEIDKRPNFILEKHPIFKTGKTELASSEVTLANFLEA